VIQRKGYFFFSMARTSKKTGALPCQAIEKLIDASCIRRARKENIRPASLDLTISDEVYRIEHLFLPEPGERIRKLLKSIEKTPHRLKNPMERGVTYLARLNERLSLPKGVYAFCNPKSTTGRNDVHARVLADGIPRYDDISVSGWHGALWIAISPRSFPVKLEKGMALSQVRFFNSDTRLDSVALQKVLDKEAIILDEGGEHTKQDTETVKSTDSSITLTLDLASDIVGYQCFSPGKVLDLSKIEKVDVFG